jgi:2-keto-4-pentenoate hydratase/2-oxohepta-3-ene-1,7-dioic acid hydratase in catechol pathway
VRLVSYRIHTPAPTTRVGALTSGGRIADLSESHRQMLLERGLGARAAERISQAIIPNDMVALIEGGEISLEAAREALGYAEQHPESLTHDATSLELISPIPRPTSIRDFMAFETHLKNIYPRLGREIPAEWYKLPAYYKGNPGSISGPGADIVMPGYAPDLDLEFEFAAVIGRGGSDIPREQALEHVYGYMIFNDFSARGIQAREVSIGLGPGKGKDFNGSNAFGPYLVTRDEIEDVYNLRMTSRINGETWCDTNTSTMHWKLEDLIAHASLGEHLWPGDVLGSGTCGDGSGAEHGKALHPGDLVELEMEGLGTLRNRVVRGNQP